MFSGRQLAAIGAVLALVVGVVLYRQASQQNFLASVFLAATQASSDPCAGVIYNRCTERCEAGNRVPLDPPVTQAEANAACEAAEGNVCTASVCDPGNGLCSHPPAPGQPQCGPEKENDPQNQCACVCRVDPPAGGCPAEKPKWDADLCQCVACTSDPKQKLACGEKNGQWNDQTCLCDCGGVPMMDADQACILCDAQHGAPDCREQCDRKFPGPNENDKREECVANCMCDCRAGGPIAWDGFGGGGTASTCFNECCTTVRKGISYKLCDTNRDFAAGCRSQCISNECPLPDGDDDDDDGGLPCLLQSERWKNLITTCSGQVTDFCPNGALKSITMFIPRSETCSCFSTTTVINTCRGGGSSTSSAASSSNGGGGDDDDGGGGGGSGDQCSPQCSQADCGNGIIEWGEECDS